MLLGALECACVVVLARFVGNPFKFGSPPLAQKKVATPSHSAAAIGESAYVDLHHHDKMSDPSKKRKRNADGSKKPSKKVAVETPPAVSNVTISLVQDADEWAPIVGMLDPICTLHMHLIALLPENLLAMLISCSFYSRSRFRQATLPEAVYEASQECPCKIWPQQHHCHE